MTGPIFDPPAGPAAPAAPVQLAGWAERLAAYLIDLAICLTLDVLIFATVALGLLGVSASSLAVDADLAGGVLVAAVLALVVGSALIPLIVHGLYGGLCSIDGGQTLGKRALGLQVARDDGRPLSFGYGVLREGAVKGLLVSLASSLTGGVAWLVDGLWPLWDAERRAVHDHLTSSRVLSGREDVVGGGFGRPVSVQPSQPASVEKRSSPAA